MEFVINFGKELWMISAEMAPYLLFGFLAAGVLSVLIKPEIIQRWLGGRTIKEVIKGSLIGVPMPLCSCSVIPVTASLRKSGAGRGATVSFLTSTPQTGVDSIAATWALIGPVFTAARIVAAFFTGIVAGVLSEWLVKDNQTDEQAYEKASTHKDEAASCCVHEEKDCCDTKSSNKVKDALQYGFVRLPADISLSLLVGLVLAGLITAFLPEDFFAQYLGNQLLAYVAVTAAAIPLYVCSTGSIPFAYALIAAGLSPGAALVFLIAGPATNTATIATMWNILGRSTTVIYLFSLMGCAWVAGFAFDLMPIANEISVQEGTASMEMVGWFSHLCAVVLIVILVTSIIRNQIATD